MNLKQKTLLAIQSNINEVLAKRRAVMNRLIVGCNTWPPDNPQSEPLQRPGERPEEGPSWCFLSLSKEATGAGSGLAAVFSFKTRIDEDNEVEFDEDIKGCCMVSESSLSVSWISSA